MDAFFQNVVIVITNFVAYIIPDMPRKLREQVRREAYLTNEIILKTELDIARGDDDHLSAEELAVIRKRANAYLLGDTASMNNRLDAESGAGDAVSQASQRLFKRNTTNGPNKVTNDDVSQESKL